MLNILGESMDLLEREQIIVSTQELRSHLSGLDLMQASMVIGIAIGLSPRIELFHDKEFAARAEWDTKYADAARQSLTRVELGLPFIKEVALKHACEVYVARCVVDSTVIAEVYGTVCDIDRNSVYCLANELCRVVGLSGRLPVMLPNTALIERAVSATREECNGEEDMSVDDLRRAARELILIQGIVSDWHGSDGPAARSCIKSCLAKELFLYKLHTRKTAVDMDKGISPTENVWDKAGVIKWKI